MTASYIIPFCSDANLENRTTVSVEESGSASDATTVQQTHFTVWDNISITCQMSILITCVVAGVVLVLSLICNVLMMLAALAKKFDLGKTTIDSSTNHSYKYLMSLKIVSLFRSSLALSGILASGVLFPFIGLSGYELLSSPVNNITKDQDMPLREYKNTVCAVMFVALSSSVYTMLGATIERWVTVFKMDPTDYLEKNNIRVDIVRSPLKEKKDATNLKLAVKKSEAFRYKVVWFYLIFSWSCSVALGILSTIYGKVKFIWFGEHFAHTDDSYTPQNTALFKFLTKSILEVSGFYIGFLYVPLFLLILFMTVTLIYLQKLHLTAGKFESYKENMFGSKSKEKQKNTFDFSNRPMSNLSIKRNTINDTLRQRVEFSHRIEHERQVTLNCQESDINALATDSIQVQDDPVLQPNQDLKIPLPPDWMKFTSLGRRQSYDSTVQVADLASPTAPVSNDSAKCYFGETAETRAALLTYSVTCLLLLPLYAFLAIDIFIGKDSIFQLNSNLNYAQIQPFSLGAGSLILYVFGGAIPFWLFLMSSPSFKDGLKYLCKIKENKPEKHMINISKRSSKNKRRDSQRLSGNVKRAQSVPSRRVTQLNNEKDIYENSGISPLAKSSSLRSWHPQQRQMSGASSRISVDVDKRFKIANMAESAFVS